MAASPSIWPRLGGTVNRAWRIIGTGLSFAVMGIGGFFLGTVACALMRAVIHDRAAYSRAVRRLVSRAFRVFVGFMSLVGVLRWRVDGMANWRPDRGSIIVANHPTLIDIVFLLALFDGADCVVKAEVLRNPFWGRLVRTAGYVSNDDAEGLLRETVGRLKAGRSVIIFPEGTRSRPGELLAFGPVTGAMAVRSACPCVPVVIRCEPPTLYKGLSWFRVPATRVDFSLTVYPEWPVARGEGNTADQRNAARQFTVRLQEFFSGELDQNSSRPERETRPADAPAL